VGCLNLKITIHPLNQGSRIRIRQEVRAAGRHPTADQIQKIERKRLKVATRIRDFHITTCRLLGDALLVSNIGVPDQLNADGYVSDEIRRPEDVAIPISMSAVENTILVFPSTIAGRPSPFAVDLRSRECRLRRAKANDTLSHVRETLSGLSFQYVNKVRQSKTTKEHLRAYSGIKILNKEVSFYQQVYNRNSRAISKLDPELKLRYPILRRSDCVINTAIANVNARGQSQIRLSWVWGARDGYDPDDQTAQKTATDNNRLMECKYKLILKFSVLLNSEIKVYRINWMRARAQKNRWEEELPRTEKEMIWTTLYFMHQRDIWYGRLVELRLETAENAGLRSYCEQMMFQWEEFSRIADFQFRRGNADFPGVWRPIFTPK